jgi:hypothetical protein
MLREHTIVWKDDPYTELDVLFWVGDVINKEEYQLWRENIDDKVFYYVEDENELNNLKDPNGVEDFYIIK